MIQRISLSLLKKGAGVTGKVPVKRKADKDEDKDNNVSSLSIHITNHLLPMFYIQVLTPATTKKTKEMAPTTKVSARREAADKDVARESECGNTGIPPVKFLHILACRQQVQHRNGL